MNAKGLLILAEHLATWRKDERFDFDYYRNTSAFKALEYVISVHDLTHDEAEALFVPGVGRVDIKADGSQLVLKMLPTDATRHEVAARIREFVKWKEEQP